MSDLLPGFRSQLQQRAGELDRGDAGAEANDRAGAEATAHATQRAPITEHGRRRRRWGRPHGRGLAVVVLVAGASVGGLAYAAATTLWQPQLGPDGTRGATATASPVPAAQLQAVSVLRRAQTDLDRNVGSRYTLEFTSGDGERIRTNAVRRVATGAGGGVIVLVPFERKRWSPTKGERGQGTRPASQRDVLCLNYIAPYELGATACGTTADLLAGRLTLGVLGLECNTRRQRGRHAEAQAREDRWARLEGRAPIEIPCHRGSEPNFNGYLFGLVPDGVASVQLGTHPGAPTVPVRDNVFQSSGAGGSGFTRDHVWLDAAGRPIPRQRAALRARLGLPPEPPRAPTGDG